MKKLVITHSVQCSDCTPPTLTITRQDDGSLIIRESPGGADYWPDLLDLLAGQLSSGINGTLNGLAVSAPSNSDGPYQGVEFEYNSRPAAW